MKCLTVLYDQDCILCQNCRSWLTKQASYIKLSFIPFQSPEIERRFPGLAQCPGIDPEKKLVVVSDEGAVYQGQSAWIMCLYALRHYREWSLRLAHPTLLPLASIACEMISLNRLRLSHFLKRSNDELKRTLLEELPSSCDTHGVSSSRCRGPFEGEDFTMTSPREISADSHGSNN